MNEDFSEQDISFSPEKPKKVDLESAIASSRVMEKMYSFNENVADVTIFKNIRASNQSNLNAYVGKMNQKGFKVLPEGADSTIAHSEDFEMSSSRETEYTTSPQTHHPQPAKKVHFSDTRLISEKSRRNMSIEKNKRNITKNLREDNDTAEQLRLKKTQPGS